MAYRPRCRRSSVQRVSLALGAIILLSLSLLRHFRQRRVVIAYFIQASPSNAVLVPHLLRALCDRTSRNVFAIHFDLSISENAVSHILSLARGNLTAVGCDQKHIHLVPREHVTYRGITLAYNYLTGAAHLLSSGVWFDYFINLSGADYPTARPSLIRELLSDPVLHRARLSFIEWRSISKWHRFARGRVSRVYVDPALASGTRGTYEIPPDDFTRVNDTFRNPMYRHIGFTIAKSSGWFIWHREFTEHLVLNPSVRRLLAVFAMSDAADEHIYASVVWNSRYFRERAVPSNFRSIFFVAANGSFALADDGISRSRQHPFNVDDTDENGNPLFWEELWNHPKFFTRKIRGESEITRRIDRDMLGLELGGRRQREYEQRLRDEFRKIVKSHLHSVPHVMHQHSPEFTTKFAIRE